MVFQEIIREDKGIVLNFFIRLAFGMILHFHETAPWWQKGVTTHLEKHKATNLLQSTPFIAAIVGTLS